MKREAKFKEHGIRRKKKTSSQVFIWTLASHNNDLVSVCGQSCTGKG